MALDSYRPVGNDCTTGGVAFSLPKAAGEFAPGLMSESLAGPHRSLSMESTAKDTSVAARIESRSSLTSLEGSPQHTGQSPAMSSLSITPVSSQPVSPLQPRQLSTLTANHIII